MADIKGWFWRVNVFVGYILMQPFVEIWKFIKLLFKKGEVINKTKTWIYIYLLFTIVAVVSQKIIWIYTFGVLAFAAFIKYEWDKGEFMEFYRKKQIEKIKAKNLTDEEIRLGKVNEIKEEIKNDRLQEGKV